MKRGNGKSLGISMGKSSIDSGFSWMFRKTIFDYQRLVTLITIDHFIITPVVPHKAVAEVSE